MMNVHVDVVVQQMLVFAVLLGIGAAAAKAKVLTPVALDSLAKIVVNITLPAMIVTLVPSAGTRDVLLKAVPMLACSFLLILFLFSLGRLSSRIGGLTGNTADVHAGETAFGNIGYMGIPLVVALYGAKGMLYISVFSVADHTLLWTLGVYLTSNDRGGSLARSLKRAVNPTTIALLIALAMVAGGIKPAGVVMNTVKGLGDTTIYLSMVYIGGTLAGMNHKRTWRKGSIYLIVLSKMILAPLIVYAILSRGGGFLAEEAVMTLTILAALPSMVTIAMLARAQGSDYEYASECVFVTTILSMITIPSVMWLLKAL